MSNLTVLKVRFNVFGVIGYMKIHVKYIYFLIEGFLILSML